MALLVDFHSHLFSRVFFDTLSVASPSLTGTPAERVEHVCSELGLAIPSANLAEHVAEWIAELDVHRVNHMVSFASVPEEAESVSEAVRLAGGRLTGFSVLDPTSPDAVPRVATLLDDLSLGGVVLFPALHGYRPDDPDLAPVFRAIGERDAIATVHCGLLSIPLRDHFGLPRPQDLTLADPLRLVPVANRHPDVRFVVPHFGAGLFRETLMLGMQCENVYVDTSSSNGWLRTQPSGLALADAFERALGVFGAERILFGTDSSVLPRGWRHEVLLAQREALGSIGLPTAERERIFGGNAARLLGLD